MTVFPALAAQSQAKEVGRATAHGEMLRRAFHLSLSRRRDTEIWRRVEEAVARLLAKKQDGNCGANCFIEADAILQAGALALIKGVAPHSERSGAYRRAVKGVYSSAALWGRDLDKAGRAYWRHCALVWLTLWHLADVPLFSAHQVMDRLARRACAERGSRLGVCSEEAGGRAPMTLPASEAAACVFEKRTDQARHLLRLRSERI